MLASLSERASRLGTENAFVVLAEVEARIRAGHDVVSFCIGQPDFAPPPAALASARAAMDAGRHGYTNAAGIHELRQAAAREMGLRRGVDIDPDDVVVAAGAKPFLGFMIASVTDDGAGHEVIYPVPGFPIYESQVRVQGAVPVPVPLSARHGWSWDPEVLEAAITPRTRLLMLNTPHNPTGAVMSAQAIDDLAEVLRRHPQVWVLADEIYSGLIHEGEHHSLMRHEDLRERILLVDGASKTYAMTGWRIGYACNKALAPVLTRWIINTHSCAAQISQWAAVGALSGDQAPVHAMRQEFGRRRDLITRGLQAIPGVRCQPSGGAFYAWPEVSDLCKRLGLADAEALRKRLLIDAGVAVLADSHFGGSGGQGSYLRFSYATSEPTIEEGLRRFAQFVRSA
jgi:aspartate/methionine/tyrosine aminotransferase